MSKITKEITVDLTRKCKTKAIFAKQFDNGCRRLLVTLTDNGKMYTPPKGAVATVNVLRADGESKAFPANITQDGKLDITLGAWTLNSVGETKCTVALYFGSNQRLSSPEIILDVGAELYEGDDIYEDSEYSLLSALLADCSEVMTAEIKRETNEQNRISEENR